MSGKFFASPEVDRLVRFDTIRLSKLLEEVQFAIIVFIIAFFIGTWTDRLFRIRKPANETSDMELIRDIALQLSLIVISAYYIMKIAHVIPFFFSMNNNYVPSSHGESSAGGGLAMAIIFISVQKNFQARIAELKLRFT